MDHHGNERGFLAAMGEGLEVNTPAGLPPGLARLNEGLPCARLPRDTRNPVTQRLAVGDGNRMPDRIDRRLDECRT